MNKTKVEFIADLLSNKAIKVEHKERLFLLVSKELNNFSEPNNSIISKLKELEADIKQLKSEHVTISDNDEEFIIGEGAEDFESYTIHKLDGQSQLKESENKDILNKRIEIQVKSPVKTESLKSVDKKVTTDLPEYKDPANLFQFLKLYNQHPVLKYTCHTIDDNEIIDSIKEKCSIEEYSLIKHQQLIEKSYNEFAKEHFVSANIKNMILVYLTGQSYDGKYNKWSSDNIDVNWKSPELISWANSSPGLIPNPGERMVSLTKNKGFKLKKAIVSSLTEQRSLYFRELVIHFKNLFHLKEDNSLKSIIDNINKTKEWNNKIEFVTSNETFKQNIELFTDVDKLIQAYNKIIEMIIEVSDKELPPKVELHFYEDEAGVIFEIHHMNSVYKKSVRNTIDRIGEGQTRLIQKQINGLCDLYLKADFGYGEFAEINLWNGQKRVANKIDSFVGVKYILKFKK